VGTQIQQSHARCAGEGVKESFGADTDTSGHIKNSTRRVVETVSGAIVLDGVGEVESHPIGRHDGTGVGPIGEGDTESGGETIFGRLEAEVAGLVAVKGLGVVVGVLEVNVPEVLKVFFHDRLVGTEVVNESCEWDTLLVPTFDEPSLDIVLGFLGEHVPEGHRGVLRFAYVLEHLLHPGAGVGRDILGTNVGAFRFGKRCLQRRHSSSQRTTIGGNSSDEKRELHNNGGLFVENEREQELERQQRETNDSFS